MLWIKRTVILELQNLFRIDENTGAIFVNAPLDSRKTNIVTYGVTVKDVNPTPEQSGQGQAYIRIKPFNTQPPVFEDFISPIIIDEEQPIGSVIISLIARDNNGIAEFKIIQQPDEFFTINGNTGKLVVNDHIHVYPSIYCDTKAVCRCCSNNSEELMRQLFIC